MLETAKDQVNEGGYPFVPGSRKGIQMMFIPKPIREIIIPAAFFQLHKSHVSARRLDTSACGGISTHTNHTYPRLDTSDMCATYDERL